MTDQQTLQPVVGAIDGPGVYEMPAEELLYRIPVGDRFAIVDAVDLHLVHAQKWTLLRAHNGKLYALAGGGRFRVYMHRLILGTPTGLETDHINGDGLDNRRANLRVATASQNRANMGKPRRPDGSTHSSRFKGVSWDRSRGRWQAKITVGGICRNLGRFDSELEAARAYDTAALEAWGEFAALNLAKVPA